MLLLTCMLEGQWSGLLRDVRMIGARVHAQLPAKDLAAQRRLRKHAVHRLLDHTLGMLLEHRAEWSETRMTHVARVAEILLVFGLPARHTHLRRVDDDDTVAGIHVRREDGLVLPANDLRDLTCEPTED